jgi:ATP-dependent RNA helicase DOB1
MDLFGEPGAFDVFQTSPAKKQTRASSVADHSQPQQQQGPPAKRPRIDSEEQKISEKEREKERREKERMEDHERMIEEEKRKILADRAREQKQKEDAEIQASYVACKHEVSIPHGFEVPGGEEGLRALRDPPFPTVNPARKYPFTLDPFQRLSIACLERGDSVLVSAHTSAGKTVVAEYAIAMGLRDRQRVIYTSPIKALSNQKYRELLEEFKDVGLMTGDVTINPSASCLVMTTEILRNMLYRGSEVMREVAWVIFDEIHYMRDLERGVVWEETLILLPDKVRYVFLSATLPNAVEFTDWIASLHHQPCHVVYTDYRPTPLQHYIFPSGGDGLFLVVDEKSSFREDNFQKALAVLATSEAMSSASRGGRGGRGRGGGGGGGGNRRNTGNDCYKIVKMIMERNYQPVIIFSFSKKECEGMALQMSKLDLNTDDEKKLVESVFFNAIDSLSEDDRKLPQVEHILPLLKRGIGIHHGGLLPILKEVIEILFQEGLLKALFATETFAMGLNMPAKTVVFTNVRKFDGSQFRWLSSGEYIQMSGRAGRRGLDDRGIVILMVDEKMEPAVAKGMLMGKADALNSSFHLGYNMLLNLLRVEGVDPEYLIKKSFHQFQSDKSLPIKEKQLADMEEKIKSEFAVQGEEVVEEYYRLREQLQKLRRVFTDTMNQPIYCLPFLQPGRLVKVSEAQNEWGWGVVVNFQKKAGQDDRGMGSGGHYIVDVLLRCAPADPAQKLFKPKPCPPGQEGQIEVVPVLLPLIEAISSVRVYVPNDLRNVEARKSVGKTLNEVQKRFPDGVPLLDPIEDMHIEDEDFKKVVRKIELLEDRLNNNASFKDPSLQQRYDLFVQKMEMENKVKVLRKQIKASQGIVLKDQLKSMKRVLRRLGLTNKDNIIELKGRVACEISSADELVLTELIFTGVLNDLAVEQIVPLMSCFVFEEKTDSAQRLADELAGPLRSLQDAARKIATISQECKLPMEVEEYVEKFKPHIMDIVYAWCKGAKFADICKMTNIFEGSIIRTMRRLEELLRQLCSASKAIGNAELESKFAQGINMIKRDIVFAVSLYL